MGQFLTSFCVNNDGARAGGFWESWESRLAIRLAPISVRFPKISHRIPPASSEKPEDRYPKSRRTTVAFSSVTLSDAPCMATPVCACPPSRFAKTNVQIAHSQSRMLYATERPPTPPERCVLCSSSAGLAPRRGPCASPTSATR
jgi:hypothetical protein